MKKLCVLVLSVMFAASLCGIAVAGSLDSSGAPSAGSGMYTLSQIYDYMNSGIDVTPIPSFQEPGAAPGSTMKTLKDIYVDLKAKYIQCDVTADNVESGKRFFSTVPGSWGVQTGTLSALPRPTATPTITPTPSPSPTPSPTITTPPTPSEGGEWVLVPGNPNNPTYEKTGSFYVMKYEAKNVSGAYSRADTTPWTSINLPNAAAACTTIGAHLCTAKEVQTINRNVEQVASNWSGGVVGTNCLYRGNTGETSGNCGCDESDPAFGTNRNAKSKLVLSNTQEIWDWSGNVREWIYGDGTGGLIDSTGGVATWRSTADWADWDNIDLNEERSVMGPSVSSWTSSQGMGQYYGNVNENGFVRGGCWNDLASAGCYALTLDTPQTYTGNRLGFRCCK